MIQKMQFIVGRVENILKKGEIYGSIDEAVSTFSVMFLKGLFFHGFKTGLCGKGFIMQDIKQHVTLHQTTKFWP